MAIGKQAVFLDRDGVLTVPVWNEATGESEAAKSPLEIELTEHAAESVKALQAQGYLVVVISNQPDAAKGKVDYGVLVETGRAFEALLKRQGVRLDGVYYCYHHPAGVLQELTGHCECRKPAPGLVKQACVELGIDPRCSWFVGDRDTDVECGRAAGCRTILIRSVESGRPGWGKSQPDGMAADVWDAVRLILEPSLWKS